MASGAPSGVCAPTAARPRLDRRRRARPRPGGARRPDRREGPRGRARRRPPRPRDAAARPADLPAPRPPSPPTEQPAPRHVARAAAARPSSPRRWCWRRSSPAATWPAPSTRARRIEPVVGAHPRAGGLEHGQFPGCNGQGFLSFGADAARRHPAHPPALHVPGRDRGARDGRARAAPAVRPSRAFWIAPLILVGQIALGAINVWAGKHAGLIVGHLALGTIAVGDGGLRGARPCSRRPRRRPRA